MVVQNMECEDRHDGTKREVEEKEVNSESTPFYDANFAAYLAFVYQQSLTENLLNNSQSKPAQSIFNKHSSVDGTVDARNCSFPNGEIQNNYQNSPQYPPSKSPSPVPEDLRIDRKKRDDINNKTTPPLLRNDAPSFKTENTALSSSVNLSNHLFSHNHASSNYFSNSNKQLDHTLYSTQEIAKMIASELRRYGIPQAIFSERVLGRSQGTLSDLLRNPKPWNKLKAGKETFRRMLEWLSQSETERLQVLKDNPLNSMLPHLLTLIIYLKYITTL